MGNKTRGVFEAQAGGERVRFQFTANAMCELEDRVDKGFLEFLEQFEKNAQAGTMRMGDVRLLVWAGLVEHQPTLTIADAGHVITHLGGIDKAMEIMQDALRQALPQAAETDADAPGNVETVA